MRIMLAAALVQSFVSYGGEQQSTDTIQAAPDAVLTAPSPGLEPGWTWAEATARDRGLDAYWIGWSVAGDTTGASWHYTDRHVPLDASARGSASQMYVSGFMGGMSFSGAKPGSLIGSTDPHEMVVLVRYERDGSRRTMTRLHTGNAIFPLRFGRGPLLWVGRATDAASVSRLRALAAENPRFRSTFVGVVGVHRSADAAVPVLRDWLQGGDTLTIRREAASWLGRHPHPVAIEALERALRQDTSTSVRSAAARALARVAPADAAIAALTRSAREDEAQSVRRSAVQAIGAIDDARAVAALARIIEDPGDTPTSSTRRDAISVVGRRERAGPTPRETVELLQRVSRNDADANVRMQAVQSLIALPDVATIPFLVSLANEHPDARAQQRAVQALAKAEPAATAADALRRLAFDHARTDTQRNATRALAQLGTDEARRILADIAERHPNADVRRTALQAVATLETR